MDESLPYRISYSLGTEKCQMFRHRIGKDYIQIAIMVQSNEDDCRYPTWYHQQCFFKTRLPPTEAAIDGFSLLRYDHQLAIKKDLGIEDPEIESQETAIDKTVVSDFLVKYSNVVLDSCEGCTQRFKMGEIRIMRFVSDVNNNQNDDLQSGQANWYHLACFARLRSEIGWLCSGDLLPGFKRLAEDDKKMIRNQIPVIKLDNRTIYNTSEENTAALEKKIRLQNEAYFKVYDYIVKNVTKDEQIEILNFNEQTVPSADEQIAHHLTDVIYFGALNACKRCQDGQLIFRNWIYKCTNESEWTACGYEDKKPTRCCAKMPPELLTTYQFLQHQCGVRTRALHSFKFVDEQGNDLVYGPYKKPLLFNMEFVLVGAFKKPRATIERLIKKFGGKVSTTIDGRVAAIISTIDEVHKMDKQIMEAIEHSIQVVTEEFLDEIQKPDTDPILYIVSKSICEWGGDPYDRIEQNDVVSQHEPDFYTKSLPEKMTQKWKDGTCVVDPECGLEENAHVYSAMVGDEEVYYSVILGLVDIERNKNSYYRMQLLESNDQDLYWVFESWGRVGTVVCSKQLKNFGELDEALDKFNTAYEDKTGNAFGVIAFEKHLKKFYHLNVDVGMPQQMADKFIDTNLITQVYDLMQMLFDITEMENLMCGFDLDLKQMPLGKISAEQIKMAMLTLDNISDLIRIGRIHELREASNKFYTLVPHAFGVSRPPVIDSIATICAENEKLESLLNMQTIYSFLEGENGDKIHPLDACYQKLKANIVPVAKNSNEFKLFDFIVQNTHGPTHNQYTLEVLEIFKVVRDGEGDRFQKQLPNHKLLWHGSRLMNFASILSNGLKIAPPEAPATGYMFGKGIYFADVVSKSANYCQTDRNNNFGLVLLCEVALGNSKPMIQAFNVEDIPNSEHQSIEALGRHQIDGTNKIDGIVAPLHGFSTSNSPTQLLYNEYVVYDTNQVKIKYLFKMKFNFKN